MWTGTRILLLLCACLSVGSAAPTAAERPLEVSSVPGQVVTLPCAATRTPGLQYLSVRWRKASESSSEGLSTGLLLRDLPDGAAKLYSNVSQEVALHGDSLSISISNVSCSDAGVYTCQLLAPVTERNREGHVRLSVEGCSEDSLVILASVMLIVAFGILLLSYVCLRNTIKGKKKKLRRQRVLLTAPLPPLEPADLRLISTLGAKPVRKS